MCGGIEWLQEEYLYDFHCKTKVQAVFLCIVNQLEISYIDVEVYVTLDKKASDKYQSSLLQG